MSIVLSPRDPPFDYGQLPNSGVGSLTIHAMNGAVILQHTLDTRAPGSLRFSDDEAAQIVTGLLSSQSFNPYQRDSISEESVLDGAFVVQFPDQPEMSGRMTANVFQQPIQILPKGCYCDPDHDEYSKDNHTTQVSIVLEEATFSPPQTTG